MTWIVITEWWFENGQTLVSHFISEEEANQAFASAKNDGEVVSVQIFKAEKLGQWENKRLAERM